MLGLEFDPALGTITPAEPGLPEFLEEIVIRNLRLGNAVTDLKVRRAWRRGSVEPLRKRGQVQVSVLFSK